MFTSAKIADLTAKVGSLETQLATAGAELTDIRASFEAQGETLLAAQEQVAAHAATIANLEAAQVQAAADFEAKVTAEVTARLASAGSDPVKRDPAAKECGDSSMARADFLKLTHAQRNKFIRDGGKLSD